MKIIIIAVFIVFTTSAFGQQPGDTKNPAFNKAQHEMFAEDDPEKREALLIKLKQNFPDQDMDQANYVVSDAYAKSKNLPKMLEYLNLMRDPGKKSWAIGYNAQRVDKYDSAAAEALLKPEIERLVKAGVPQDTGKSRYYGFLYLYSDILIKQGKYKEALNYIKEAYDHIPQKSDQMNGDYGLAMSKNGFHAEALPVLQTLVNDGKANPELKKAFAESSEKLNPVNEKDLVTLMNSYIYNAHKRDSVAKITVQRFPKGDFAFNDAQRNLYKEEDAGKREELFKKLQKGFPERNLDQAYFAVASGYVKVKNLSKVTEYIKQITDVSLRGMATAMNAQEMMSYDPRAAENLTKPEIERLTYTGVPQEPRAKGNYYAFLNIYGTILIRNDKYKEALIYVKDVYDHTTRRDEQLSGNYGLVLSKNNQHLEALPILQKLVDEARADVKIKKAFEESYTQVNPGKNAKDYLADIDRALNTKMQTEVDKMGINEPSPNFTVKDVDGKEVSLADFKGKTIVLDFWATWCGPCKKSFPFMQSVVNSYKKDPKVKFLFIHTRETVADPLSDAKNYLSANNYKFDLYMDVKDPKTKKNEAVTAFGAKGIPAKFVIDGKGNIRFKIIGFSGGDDAAIAELSYMIETSKKHS